MGQSILHINDKRGEHAPSWYAASAKNMRDRPSAKGALHCDVVVVGAGFTGLSASLHLAERGYDVILIDAHRVGWGASGRNGGQLCTGQRREQEFFERHSGMATAQKIWDIAEQAKKLVRDLIKRYDIPCDYRSGIIHAAYRRRLVDSYRKQAEKLQESYNYQDIRFINQAEIRQKIASDRYYGGTLDEGAGHLHPLNFALGLAKAAEEKGVRIYEKTELLSFNDGDPICLKTEEADIKSRFMILACNGYLGNLEPRLARYILPINNFIIATAPMTEKQSEALIKDQCAVSDSLNIINYYRFSADHRLLFGGGESFRYRFPSDIRAVVTKPMVNIFPQLKDVKIEYAWGGTLAITFQRTPIYKRVSGNIMSAGGYCGQGVALGTFSGAVMAEAISGIATRFDIMRSLPQHRFPGGNIFRHPLMALGLLWYALKDRI